MKVLLTSLLALSLAGNALLLAVLFVGRETSAVVAPPSFERMQVAVAPATPAIDQQTWTNLSGAELPAMVTRLREAGFPPEAIRMIMAAHLRELYSARMKALDPGYNQRPFWKSYTTDPRVQAGQMQLYREQQKVLRTLLGADAEPAENVNALFQGRRFDSVPPDKLGEVQRILRDFEDARQDIYSQSGGLGGAEMQKRIAAMEKDQHEALARLFTPQELVEWDIRNSETARSLRSQLAGFNPTEEEFRAIFKLQAGFDDQFGRLYTMPSVAEQQRRGEAQRLLNEQIKAALGPVRAADYERASDYNYRQTSQLVARLELPPETTNQVYAVQKSIMEKARDLYRSNPAETASRHPQLAALAQETQTRVTAILGERGFEAYRQYGGQWMQMLRPPPPSSPAPGR